MVPEDKQFGRSGASAPSGHSASPEPVVSALRASVPNAVEADTLGALLDTMNDWPMTDTQRAVAIVGTWEAIKMCPPAEALNDD